VQDEIALLSRAQILDKKALAQIHDMYYAAVYRYVSFRVDDPQTAEDLTSDVFVRFMYALRDHRAPSNTIRGWLYGAASLVIKEHYRQQKKMAHMPLHDGIPSKAMTPAQQAETKSEQEQLHAAMVELTEDQQKALELRYDFSMSIRETARVMGKSEGAVKMLQSRAITALSRILNRGA